MSHARAGGIAGAAVTALLVAFAPAAATHTRPPRPEEKSTVLLGAPIAPFRLIDQDGRPFDLAGTRGKIRLVSFFFTGCRESCPLVIERLRSATARLTPAERAGVHLVSITVDPAHDDPATLRRYASERAIDREGWSLLTGGADEILEAGKRFQAAFRPRAGAVIDHTATVYLLDGDAVLKRAYPIAGLAGDAIVHDVRTLLGTR